MLKIHENANGAKHKAWPADCIWPEPVEYGTGEEWDVDLLEMMDLDEEGEDLLRIREYYDDLVVDGILNEDYTVTANLEHLKSKLPELVFTDEEGITDFYPEIGENYWFDGFDVDMWKEDLNDHINALKISAGEADPVAHITEIIGYVFINENLLRQAFTRRSFAIEYGLAGCCEELEFIGDSVIGAVVTREMSKQLAQVDIETTDAPFQASYDEGDFTKIRSQFVSKEHLAKRAALTGLDKYILYASSEVVSESSREDMIEALVGAVAIDSEWNWEVLEEVVDRLLLVQLGQPGLLLHQTYYDKFNAWHQKHFGCMPIYEVGKWAPYWCMITFFVPGGSDESDLGSSIEDLKDFDARGNQIELRAETGSGVTAHKIEARGQTRSEARELAAELAQRYIVSQGKWMNLKNAGVEPRLEDSINQLQELYQKKYLEDQPSYVFNEMPGDQWVCMCRCDGIIGSGRGPSKTAAKKKAAYMVIVKLLDSAGLCKDEWREKMNEMM